MGFETHATDSDTIVAIATAPGRGGVGVVRLSGPKALTIAQTLCAKALPLQPRVATLTRFRDAQGNVLDSGLCLSFPGPASFTGEDVAELQGHGSPLVLDAIVRTAIGAGARMARPGEFSERAYLNGKMDLAQAEAVADLINAASDASARAAVRSLQGEFSARLNRLSADLVALRVQVEAAIDFPDEDIELLGAPAVVGGLEALSQAVEQIVESTRTGVRLTEGARLVLVGAPNVGKSSVLNRLCGEDRAIVTAVAGTTRDLVREQLLLAGIPVELIDTAGIRTTEDLIEAEGVRRAETAARQADLILAIYDLDDPSSLEFLLEWLQNERSDGQSGRGPSVVVVGNKKDIAHNNPEIQRKLGELALTYKFGLSEVSAKTGEGLADLTERLVELLSGASVEEGFAQFPADTYSARSRHLSALQRSLIALKDAQTGIKAQIGAELVAEHLRHAGAELGSVCGEITTDELLGEIFSSFCIGK